MNLGVLEIFILIGFLVECTHLSKLIKTMGLSYYMEIMPSSKDHISGSYIVSFFNNFDYLLPFLMHIILHISTHVTLIKHIQIVIVIVIILKMRK